jgi:hypothetical protein
LFIRSDMETCSSAFSFTAMDDGPDHICVHLV